MKIAGRKNDGAWFRTNKFINKLGVEDRAKLIAAAIANAVLMPQALAAFVEIQSLASTVGVNVAGGLDNGNAWLTKIFTSGIPRQVWYGRYTFMTYSKVGAKYVPDFGTQLFHFSKLLRRFMKNYLFGLRGWNDLTDTGALGNNNPGGLPDANKAH